MHYYKRNIGDYHKKAGRLSMLEHGAYTLLIDSCYDRERFPSEEEAIDWCWARSDEEINAVKFVLSRFFTLVDGLYVQDRISEEIESYRDRALKNKEIAENRERERREKRERVEHDSCTDRHLTINQEPLTINQEPEDQKHRPAKAELDAAFEVFWKAYPKKVSKKDAAKAWSKIKPDKHQSIMKGLFNHMSCEQWVKDNGQYIPNAATWLNKERWEDEIRPYAQRTEASRDNSAVGRVKARAAERERARQGAQPEYFGGGDFIEGEFASGPQVDGPPLDSYGGDLWAQVDEPVR